MARKYDGKVALVTGAGSGLGRLAARRLANAGASVAALDIDRKGLDETASYHESIYPYVVDVTQGEKLDEVVTDVVSRHGSLDRVMHAAAIMPYGKILEQSAADILHVMHVNYDGLVNVTKSTLSNIIENGGGDFVVFSSMLGQMPVLYGGAYCASKFAASVFTEILAHENQGRGVRFACVCPPAVQTPLLLQAKDTVWPKVLDERPAIEPELVLDAIEISLSKGQFWVFPGKGTRVGWLMRRLAPDLVWRNIHQVEAV